MEVPFERSPLATIKAIGKVFSYTYPPLHGNRQMQSCREVNDWADESKISFENMMERANPADEASGDADKESDNIHQLPNT